MRKLWGGVFGAESHQLVESFGQSIQTDLEFWREDVIASQAHARMLAKVGILSSEDSEKILRGLDQILADGPELLPQDVEDIHTAVEARLAELIGEAAGRLHTARSRNDQVAVDARLALRTRLDDLADSIKALQGVLMSRSESDGQALLPGVTHQQHAQPIRLQLWFLAHFWALQRHGWRVQQVRQIVNWSPLGAAALAGSPFPIDRHQTAAELEFAGPLPNALDATSDRSFILDSLHLCAGIMIDLSRISQDLILWSMPEMGFVQLDDGVTTGSSIMPQKRNPDMAELIRGRTGRVIGAYTALACTMKALPLGYNRDTQEDKPALFDALRLTNDSLGLVALMLQTAVFRTDRMERALYRDFSTATELADGLAEQGMAFREAHERAGMIVRDCLQRNIGLEDLSESELSDAGFNDPAEMKNRLQPGPSADRRNSYGGVGSEALQIQSQLAQRVYESSGFGSLYGED